MLTKILHWRCLAGGPFCFCLLLPRTLGVGGSTVIHPPGLTKASLCIAKYQRTSQGVINHRLHTSFPFRGRRPHTSVCAVQCKIHAVAGEPAQKMHVVESSPCDTSHRSWDVLVPLLGTHEHTVPAPPSADRPVPGYIKSPLGILTVGPCITW